ncbi:MAG: ribonuclease [Phycisphaerae bacterium SM23_30]|nr:MAG: ribonuclease [Phycisphaerae bacterium SM23_30]
MQLFTILALSEGTYIVLIIMGLIIGLFGGGAVLWLVQRAMGKSRTRLAQQESEAIIADARYKSENIVKTAELEAKAEKIQKREESEREAAEIRNQLREQELHLTKREDTVDRKWESVNSKERSLENLQKKLSQKERDLTSKDQQLTNTLAEQRAQLLRIAGISVEEAKEMLLKRLEGEVTHEASALVERLVTNAKEEATQRAREITLNAIQRYAADHTCDSTISSVDIQNDEMKGRVIGREGRNIRAFEKATGVDVIIDDTPGLVIISAFDPIRREVARISLDKLIQDGRIHPARIEEVVAETQKEVDAHVLDIGKSMALEANVNGLNNKLIPYLGRLNYRTSYGQNVLRHSVEVAYLCQTMAEELRLNGDLARRCGLLHDIGKAADHEVEGGHPEIGAELLRKFNEKSEVINAAAGHHNDVPATSPYTPLVAAADAMSASRPGARRETLERYIKRLEQLENLATSFKGIRQAYAIQAGREVRVIVDPEKVNDGDAWQIAREIAQKVEQELTYPGEIKVTLLREVRCVEYAR